MVQIKTSKFAVTKGISLVIRENGAGVLAISLVHFAIAAE